MRGRIHLRGFWRDQHGASAVEFALIAPLLIGLLLGIIQYGSLFLLQTRMNDTARDTARRLAVGELASEADAEAYAVARLADWSGTFTAAAELPDPGEHDVSVTITVPKEEAALINLVGFGMDGQLGVEFHMLKE
ncbi:MAG: TadE/TadG family type IV pilus assembly protein [Burkholderiales bacterium]